MRARRSAFLHECSQAILIAKLDLLIVHVSFTLFIELANCVFLYPLLISCALLLFQVCAQRFRARARLHALWRLRVFLCFLFFLVLFLLSRRCASLAELARRRRASVGRRACERRVASAAALGADA